MLKGLWKRFVRSQKGQASMEYIVGAAIVIGIAIGAVSMVMNAEHGAGNTVSQQITTEVSNSVN